ncbi:unnamed protein product [Polarella glacialis]|uniref:Uncharacterized protein n=1 Tax=Polarella glacialis TaxID=89957 RepID=A0A813E9G5_POLGL|nr:unnamed protein product [Polarella glacialis]
MLLARCCWQKSEDFAVKMDSPEDRMHHLAALLQTENYELQSKLTQVLVSCTEVQGYFSISEKAKANLAPFDLFCGHISTFEKQLGAAWQEIERNPGRWQQFASAADSANAARQQFAIAARQQFASASRAQRKSLGAMTEEEVTSRGHSTWLDVSQAPPVSRTSARSRAASAPSQIASRRSSGKRTPFRSPSRPPSPPPVGEESLEPAQGKGPPPKGFGKAVEGPPLVKGAPKAASIPPPAKGPWKGEMAAEPPEEGAARRRTPRTATGSELQSNLGQEMLPENAGCARRPRAQGLLLLLKDMFANLLGSQGEAMGVQELQRSGSPPRHHADRTQDIVPWSRAASSRSSRSSLTHFFYEELAAQPTMEVESKKSSQLFGHEQLDQNEDRGDMEIALARTYPGPNSDDDPDTSPPLSCIYMVGNGDDGAKQSCTPSWHSEQEQDKSPPTSPSRRLDLTRTRNPAVTLDDAVLARSQSESELAEAEALSRPGSLWSSLWSRKAPSDGPKPTVWRYL